MRGQFETPFEPTSKWAFWFVRKYLMPAVALHTANERGPFNRSKLLTPIIKSMLTEQQQQSLVAGRYLMSVFISRVLSVCLRRQGYRSISPGVWDLSEAGDELTEEALDPDVGEADEAEATGEQQVGGWVYAYSFPMLLNLSPEKHPIKVGMTHGDVDIRVTVQTRGEASFERPVILNRWPAANPREMEQAIHAILKLRGRHMKNSPGVEWFMTSSVELDGIVKFLGVDAPIQWA